MVRAQLEQELAATLKRIAQAALLAAVFWSAVVGFSLYWNESHLHKETLALAHKEAEANILKDLSFREWVGSHKGVYVEPDTDTPPNPFLGFAEDRDVVTTSGKKLTLMNPAYATRQIHQIYSARYGLRGHLTSLNPLNPANTADPWETKALKEFEQGKPEVAGIVHVGGKTYYRLMRPLAVESSCLPCHARQGYRLGDIRGGLTADVPLAPYLASEDAAATRLRLTHGGVYLVGLALIAAITLRFRHRARERLRMAVEIANSQKLFRTVTETASEWIFWRNVDGSMRYNSPACERITGYPPEAFAADPNLLTSIVHPSYRDLWNRHTHLADRDGNPTAMELKIVTRSGDTRWINHVCHPIYGNDGDFLGTRGRNIDVTVRHEQEHLFIQQSRLAAMGEMIGNIAHQWRQPLTALSLSLQNMRDDYEYGDLDHTAMEASVQHSLDIIERMSHTIDDFRSFFRVDKEKSLFSPSDAVRDSLSILGASLKNSGITVNIEGNGKLHCFGYPNEYAQVVVNLLTNAKQAIAGNRIQQGKIDIRIEEKDGQTLLRVCDNGGGIPQSALDRIFEPYFTTKETGTGIGLYLSKMIIEQGMGGNIEARNTVDGAEFLLRLPASPPN